MGIKTIVEERMNYFKNMGVIFEKTKNESFSQVQTKTFAEYEIKQLEDFKNTVMDAGANELAEEIEQKIGHCNRGWRGEEKVGSKLQFCNLDMYVLYCLYFEFELNNYTINTQIDYLVITPKNLYFLECKNWKKDIGIDKFQNFYLIFPSEPRKRIASPFEQLDRQVTTVRKMIEQENNKFWKKAIIRHIFKKNCKLVLVLADDGERVYRKDEKGEKIRPIVHTDHLTRYIEETDKRTRNGILYYFKRKILYSWIGFFEEKCVKMKVKLEKYEEKLEEYKKNPDKQPASYKRKDTYNGRRDKK